MKFTLDNAEQTLLLNVLLNIFIMYVAPTTDKEFIVYYLTFQLSRYVYYKTIGSMQTFDPKASVEKLALTYHQVDMGNLLANSW